MKILTADENVDVDIDVESIVMGIDRIFHETITDRTLITISHDRIYEFVTRIISDNNAAIIHQRNDDRLLDELIKRKEAEFHDKLDAKKTVRNLNGISNKFKFYILGYILMDGNDTMED